jgi:uncharacterized protein (DUF924 family)
MTGHREQASQVLAFWFSETQPRQWFAKDPAFDALVGERFLGLIRRAIAGDLDAWSAEPSEALALVLLLDQFPRQIWRDTAMAFAGDPQAQALSLQALDRGWVEAESEEARRQFWLMPLMHSEDLAVQEAALPLFKQLTDPRTADFARRHRDVIARFGRFPHRNEALGRVSSAAELAFLQTPGSRF